MDIKINYDARKKDTEGLFDYLRARVLDRGIPVILSLSPDSQKIYVTYPFGSWLERLANGRDNMRVLGEYLIQFYRLIREPFDRRSMGSLPPISQRADEPPFKKLKGNTVVTVAWGYCDLDYQHEG